MQAQHATLKIAPAIAPSLAVLQHDPIGLPSYKLLDVYCCPAAWALAVVLLLAGGAILTRQRTSAAAADGKVKYIHVITTNSSCDGVHATPAEGGIMGSNGSADAAVPAGAAGLLSAILPLTNFSSLTSGQVLDAAAAAITSVQQLQPLMQLHQHLWCRYAWVYEWYRRQILGCCACL